MYQQILKLIKKIQKQARCPVCNSRYDFKKIKIKYILDEIAVLHLNCDNGHDMVQSIHIVIFEKNEKITQHASQQKYISINNKRIIDKQINEFDGDFIKLWKK